MGHPESAPGQIRPWRIADALSIAIRESHPGDHNYIIDSWHKSARAGMAWVPMHIYLPEMRARIIKLMKRGVTAVACDPDDANFIIGWACTEKGVLHYVFVRHAFQGADVCQRLIVGLPTPLTVTHCTPDWERAWANKRWAYAPSRIG